MAIAAPPPRARSRREYDGLESGELAWILGRRFLTTDGLTPAPGAYADLAATALSAAPTARRAPMRAPST